MLNIDWFRAFNRGRIVCVCVLFSLSLHYSRLFVIKLCFCTILFARRKNKNDKVKPKKPDIEFKKGRLHIPIISTI